MNAKLKNSPSTWVDPDDAPEITDEWIAGAEPRDGEKCRAAGKTGGQYEDADDSATG